jgi:DNA (cytosine-5)-methyltransferase 1
VDHASQPRYPFADAIRFLQLLLDGDYEATGGVFLEEIDAIHASPPCQGYSRMARTGAGADKPRLIPDLRKLLLKTGKPYVIENVEGAELIGNSSTLCGTMFGLRVRRHRLFEIEPPLLIMTPPCRCKNGVVKGRLIGHRVGGRVAPGRTKPPHATESDRREAIGVPWMTTTEARQAIPPAYTEAIGRQLADHIRHKRGEAAGVA